MVRASSHVLYLFSVVESTEPKQVYGDKLVFVSERTIKDIITPAPAHSFIIGPTVLKTHTSENTLHLTMTTPFSYAYIYI
jgi:hypothetical protein